MQAKPKPSHTEAGFHSESIPDCARACAWSTNFLNFKTLQTSKMSLKSPLAKGDGVIPQSCEL